MSSKVATLHLVCGKIAAGKSTLVSELGQSPTTIVTREDPWLAQLYPGELHSITDYARCSARRRRALAPHLIEVLRSGLSIALDFPANTVGTRAWMRTLFEQAGCRHRLHYLDVADEVCKTRLRQRNESGKHEFSVGEEEFDLFTSHFVPPSAEEMFEVILHRHC